MAAPHSGACFSHTKLPNRRKKKKHTQILGSCSRGAVYGFVRNSSFEFWFSCSFACAGLRTTGKNFHSCSKEQHDSCDGGWSLVVVLRE